MSKNNSQTNTTLSIQAEPSLNEDFSNENDETTENVSVKKTPNKNTSSLFSNGNSVSFLPSSGKKKSGSSPGTSLNVYKEPRSNDDDLDGIPSEEVVNDSMSISIDEDNEGEQMLSSKEELSIESLHGASRYMQDASVSRLRPELIASLDWLPGRNGKGYKTSVDMLLDYRWYVNQVMSDNVNDTMEVFADENPSETYDTLKENYDKVVNEVSEEVLHAIFEFMEALSDAKGALDIKDSSEKINSLMSKFYNNKNDTRSSIDSPTLSSLFTNTLKFSEGSYKSFSNTKVFAQAVHDLAYACKFHSPLLLSSDNLERIDDLDPLKINKNTLPKGKKFKFNPRSLGNVGTYNFDATSYSDYSSFLSSLPVSDNDKIKVLLMSISRELTLSMNIGDLNGRSSPIIKRYMDERVPGIKIIDNIFGVPSNDILDSPGPEGSLLDYIHINSGDDIVLPFETRVITDNKSRKSIPGSVALVDSIHRYGNSDFDTTKYSNFVSGFSKSTSDASLAIENILSLKSESRLQPAKVFESFITKFVSQASSLSSVKSKDQEQSVLVALLSEARHDQELRHLLFRYLLEVRDVLDDIETDTQQSVETELTKSGNKRTRKQKLRQRRLDSRKAFAAYKSLLTSDSISKNLQVNKSTAKRLFASAVNPISTTSMRISAHILKNAVSTSKVPDDNMQISSSSIYTTLQSAFRSTSPEGNIFVSMVSLAKELQQLAGTESETPGTYLDGEGLTLVNKWDENTLMLLVYELFVSLFSNMMSVGFVLQDSGTPNVKPYIIYDTNKNSLAINDMTALFSEDEEPDNKSTVALLLSDLLRERSFINKMSSFIEAVGSSLKTSSEQLDSFFGKDSRKNQSEARKSMSILNTPQAKRFLDEMTWQQFLLINMTIKKLFPRPNDKSYLPSSIKTTESELAALKALMMEPAVSGRTGENIRVLSVGIPSGLTESLYNPPYMLGSEESTEIGAPKNVVDILVYKRDLEFEDLVFKPKRYTFDTSLFLLPTSYDSATTYNSYNDVLQSCTFTTAPDKRVKNVYSSEHSSTSLLDSGRYEYLGEGVDTKILSNHVTDDLLKKYYKLLFGMSFDESSFLFHDIWSNLIVDDTTANTLKVMDANKKLKYWVRNGRVPAHSLFRNITVDGQRRQRVVTAGEKAVWKYLRPISTKSRLKARPKSKRINYRISKIKFKPKFNLSKRRAPVSSGVYSANKRSSVKHTFSTMGANPRSTFSKTFNIGGSRGMRKSMKRSFSRLAISGPVVFSKYHRMKRKKRRNTWATKKYSVSRSLTPEALNSFRMLCSSCLFSKEALLQQSLSPKLFDRVLLLPVDPDDFEIDIDATKESNSGDDFMNQKLFSELTIDVTNETGQVVKMLKPRRHKENYSSFNEFFVVVATPDQGVA